ncbi:MAG: hypothetical protein BWK80_22360 [Desulfobacteraceae bacterium IS3]|nr:MAG: hypothetical protein BWK80_22360 [Desulfobacteraceae bacterium IS3]
MLKKFSAFIVTCIVISLSYGTAYSHCNCDGCCTSNGGVVCRNGVTMCADGTSLSSECISKACTAEWCSGCYDGQWSGKTSQRLEVSFDVSDNNVTNMIIGFTPCGTEKGMLQKHVGPYSVGNDRTFSFTKAVACNPLIPSDTISYIISGTFSNNLTCRGTWQIVGGISGTWEAANMTASEPNISASPESVSFGEKIVGSSQNQTVTITNSGGASLKIEKISIAGTNASAFKIEKDNCSGQTLSSYTTATIELAFSPDSNGAKTATLRIASDDPATPILMITLSGTGVLAVKSLVADFGAKGIYFYDGASWNGLLDWDAENIIAWGNKLVADFGNKGIYVYDGTLWDGLAAWNPDDMAVWKDKLVADFGERGIYLYNGSSWTGLTTWNPDKLVVWGDKLAANFGANGIYQYDGQAWKGLTVWNSEKMIEWNRTVEAPTETDADKDGYTSSQGDCNDNSAAVHPGATETCGDGIDQDCSGKDLACSGSDDNDKDGYTASQGDCNDNSAAVHPGATETCGDGIDQDCSGSDCSIGENNLDAAAISDLVARHNYWREQVGVAAVTWSSEVAAYAQEWADNMQTQGCGLEHRRSGMYGENLAGGYGMSAQEVVDMWAGEKAYYNYESNSCNGVCGHYTQVVWRSTTQIGCGMASCGGKEVWVCNYNPAGNYIGMKPY